MFYVGSPLAVSTHALLPLVLILNEGVALECKGAGKPSFLSTFIRIMQQHVPDLCVLMEMRLFGPSLARI